MSALARGAGAFVIACAIVACVGDDPVQAVPVDGDGGSSGSSGTSSGSSGSSGSSSGSSGSSGTSSGSSGSLCTPADNSCNGTNLHACNTSGTAFADSPCANGCATTPTAHCKVVVPSANGLTVADVDGAGLGPTAFGVSTTIDTATGTIGGLRTANVNPATREVISGIAFHVVAIPGTGSAKIGIFTFGSLVVGDGKNIGFTGANAVALVSANDMTISGILDLRTSCAAGNAGPGGGAGGSILGLAQGTGKGTAGASNASDATSGGGGGGYGDLGGNTSQLGVGKTTLGGPIYGLPTLIPLVGGSGGGRGGDGNSATATTGGNGGGGGGAIQLVANGQILIGGSAIAGVNASGCGGKGANAPPTGNGAGAGGGGGSGGAILIEGASVKLDALSALVVNGGNGGGGASGAGANATAGQFGQFTTDQSGGTYVGNPTSASCGKGGAGGASSAAPSSPHGFNGATGGVGGCTGGAGGASGRIRINSLGGAATFVGSAYASPRLGDLSTAAEALTTQGTLVAQ